ncbi:MAG: polymer-forming cytoskeletal protein [Acidobacteriia bacterium]|nr:polymer-forming cytoskeletal protein [Terriglobia bacterium]
MALGWFDRKRQDAAEWTGFLEQGVRLEGKLETTGTFRIDSTMKGSIVSDDTLVLGEHASIQGQITGNRVVISGRFDGVVQAKTSVEIHSTAVVTGEVHTPSLLIEPGAVFDGQCHMLAATEAAKPVTIPIRSGGQAAR